MLDEHKWWYRLALKIGWPVRLVQKTTTSKEFIRWRVYLTDFEPNEFHREDWYSAALRATIEQANSKKGRKIKLKDKLLRFVFERKAEKKEPTEIDPGSGEPNWVARMKQSKRNWFALLGFSQKLVDDPYADPKAQSADDYAGSGTEHDQVQPQSGTGGDSDRTVQPPNVRYRR